MVSQTLDVKCKTNSLVVFVSVPQYVDWVKQQLTKKIETKAQLNDEPKVNPCDFTDCGTDKNSYCEIENSKAVCRCHKEFIRVSESCYECVFDLNCPKGQQCFNLKCVDLCQNFNCGTKNGARCAVENRRPLCKCNPGFKSLAGDCRKCLKNSDCASNEICSIYKLECINPCRFTSSTCNDDTECVVEDHIQKCRAKIKSDFIFSKKDLQ